LAASNSVTMFFDHLNHKFFTPERIDVCASLTKRMLRNGTIQNIAPAMCFVENYFRETLLILFEDQKFNRKRDSFIHHSYALASFFNENIAGIVMMCTWFEMMHYTIENIPSLTEKQKDEISKKTSPFLSDTHEIVPDEREMIQLYKDIFEKVSPRIRAMSEEEHAKHLKNINNLTAKKTFTPNEKFKSLIQETNEFNYIEVALQVSLINFSTDDETVEYIVNTIVNAGFKNKKSEMFLAIYGTILDQKPLEKPKFRTAMQHKIETEIDKLFLKKIFPKDTAAELIKLILILGKNKLITRLGIANVYRRIMNHVQDMDSLKQLGTYIFVVECMQHTLHLLIGAKAFPKNTEKILIGIRDEMISSNSRISDGDFKITVTEVLKRLDSILNQHKLIANTEQKKKQEEEEEAQKKENQIEKNM
jgi:hypothetical protein